MIPLKDWSTGKLLGVNSRTVIKNYNEFGIKKYFITPTYKKHLNLFGLYENREAIENAGYIVIVEGEKSVLKRDSLQDSTLVALSGHTMSDAQVSIIKSLNINEVIIALDKDVPIQESRHICDKIARYKKVSYMYDKWDLLGEKDSPADADNKRYKFLFDHRITYDSKEQSVYKKGMKK
jgi:DNA primase